MSNDEILHALGEIAQEISGTDPADLAMEKAFAEDLGIDSIEKAEIVFAAEDRFGILIPDDASKQLKTVGQAVTYIASHVPQD